MLAEGHTQHEAARTVGVTDGAITQFLDREPEIRKQVKAIQQGIILEAGPLAKDNTIRCIKLANDIFRKAEGKKHPGAWLEDNKVAVDLADKKEKRVLNTMGISGAPTQSVFLQQIFQDNRTQVFTPVALQAAAAYLGRGELDPDLEAILDAEVEEVDQDQPGIDSSSSGKAGVGEPPDRHEAK